MRSSNDAAGKSFKVKWWRTLIDYSVIAAPGIVMLILPFFVSTYVQSMIIKIFVFAVFAVSLNILWGYTGLFSLGHAVYLGIAGYTVGILTTRFGIGNFWLIALAGISFATIAAAILGVLALRVADTYFLLVTLAMGELFYSLALRLRGITGGSNGMAGIHYPHLGIPFLMINDTSFYYLVFIFFLICLYLIYRFVKSPFGQVLQGIRENESRMTALGYDVWFHKYIAFIVGGLFAGVAGVLFAYYNHQMTPVEFGIMTSTMGMLMVIIGSCTTVFGPALGAGIVVLLEHLSSIYAPQRWPLILGSVFVFAVIFLPGGFGSHLLRYWRKVTYGRIEG